MTNDDVARRLMTHARELDRQGGNVYRARAYRAAATALQSLARPAEELLAAGGRRALEAIPGVGAAVAASVESLLRTGQIAPVNPADSAREPRRLFTSLPGVGRKLAEDFRDRLGVRDLGGLLEAAEAGRLGEVGVGPKRLASLLAALRSRVAGTTVPADEPPLDDLLAIDAEFRDAAAEREDGVLDTHRAERGGWALEALFAECALAHRMERSRDWVVVSYARGARRGKRTVVTETGGEMAGRRVVRGREGECRRRYGVAAMTSEPAA